MAFNVLVVDDSSVMRAMIIKTLRMCEVDIGEIHQAGNGKEGLGTLQENWIDLVIVDINMPIMSGLEMIGQMEADPLTEKIKIIIISTEGNNPRVEGLKEKGVRFIHKPFTPETIRDVIFDVMETSNEQQT
ncbi:MAG: response regulator [Deltaproteobacteria bacterium]|nr:response regulator [Deltaproteobacteria bacterium]